MMSAPLRTFLVVMAVLTALVVMASAWKKAEEVGSVYYSLPDMPRYDALDPLLPSNRSTLCYPYRWQQAQRDRLIKLSKHLTTPPSGTDPVALARYAHYAIHDTDKLSLLRYEAVMREGMRRDPNNALYHYLLADRLYNTAVGYEYRAPHERKTEIDGLYVKNRPLFNRAMHEMFIGLHLPYQSRRDTYTRAMLSAMPAANGSEAIIDQGMAIFGMNNYTLDGIKLRAVARENMFYLACLLSEGRHAEASNYLHTGETIARQLTMDNSPCVYQFMAAWRICDFASKNDAKICRLYGLTREAAGIERRCRTLSAGISAYLEQREKYKDGIDPLLRTGSGFIGYLVLPRGVQRGVLTSENMRPERLVEYVVMEQVWLGVLLSLLMLLLLYSGLHALRERLLLGTNVIEPAPQLPISVWLRAIGYGFLLPLALYFVYVSLPQLSGREHAIVLSLVQFYLGIGLFGLWVLIVPAAIVSGAMLRHAEEPQTCKSWAKRVGTGLCALIWTGLAWIPFLLVFIASLSLIYSYRTYTNLYLLLSITSLVVLTGVVFMPLFWQRRRPHPSAVHLHAARAVISVYAVIILLTGTLYYPVSYLAERHFLRENTLHIVNDGEIICLTPIEANLVKQLRQSVLDGIRANEGETVPTRRIIWGEPPR